MIGFKPKEFKTESGIDVAYDSMNKKFFELNFIK